MDSSFESIRFTANAKKIIDNFLQQCVSLAQKRGTSSTLVEQIAKEKICENVSEDTEIDAEGAMNILEKIPPSEDIVASCKKQYSAASFQLSLSNRFVGGVCGGIAEYFQVDATLVRVAFIAGSFAGGMTIFAYIILWLALYDKSKNVKYSPLVALVFHILQIIRTLLVTIFWFLQKKTNVSEENEHISYKKDIVVEKVKVKENAVKTPKKNVFRRTFAFLSFVFMSMLLYLPAIFVLLAISSFCIWGIFYPIVDIDNFHFRFAAIDAGIAVAISAAAVTFLLFLLVVTFIGRLHFKAKVMGKTTSVLTIVSLVVCLFILGSSVGIVLFQNQDIETKTVTHDLDIGDEMRISPQDWQNLEYSNIRIENVKLQTDLNAKKITVRCNIRARGENQEQAQNHLQGITPVWKEGHLFPRITKQGDSFHFESAYLEVTLPPTKKLFLEGRYGNKVELGGNFDGDISVVMEESRVFLHDLQAKTLSIDTKGGYVHLKKALANSSYFNINQCKLVVVDSKIEKIKVDSLQSQLELINTSGELALSNHEGALRIVECQGSLQVENFNGSIRVKHYQFKKKSKSSIKSQNGTIKIALSTQNLPQINIKNEQGRVKNRLPNFTTNEAFVDFEIFGSRLSLMPLNRAIHSN